jgi:uncharacterized protein YaaN involved in tellurite resistance
MDVATAPAVASTQLSVMQAQHPELLEPVLKDITGFGSLIDITTLPKEELAEVEKLAASSTLDDPGAVENWGYEFQKAWSDGLSMLLGASTLKDAGPGMYDFIAHDLKLSADLVQNAMQAYGAKDDISMGRKIMRSMPFGLGAKFSTAEVIVHANKELTRVFDELEKKIAACKVAITEGDVTVDMLMKAQRKQLVYIRRYILAGEKLALSLKKEFQDRVQALPAQPDPLVIADLKQKRLLLIGFETRIVGLRNAYVKGATLLPTQLETIRAAGKVAMQNLNDTQVVTIPDLKVAALQLVALNKIDEGNKTSAAIRDQANRAAQQAADLTHKTAVEAKKQQGQVKDDAERLKMFLNAIQKTGEELAALDEQNRQRREEAMKMQGEMLRGFEDSSRRVLEHFASAK